MQVSGNSHGIAALPPKSKWNDRNSRPDGLTSHEDMGKQFFSQYFFAFLKRVLLTHRNACKAKVKTPAELVLGRKIRLPTIIDFDVCEKIPQIEQRHIEAQPATFITRRGANKPWIQSNQSERSALVSDKQIARCSQETSTKNETSDVIDDETAVQHENREQPSPTPEDQLELVSDEPKRSSRFRKPTIHYGDPIPTDLLRKGVMM